MVTFIVPTLWKSKKIFESIESFKKTDMPFSEFIIIDNGNSSFYDPRIKIIKQKQSIFTNPAWNLGVRYAGNSLLCFLNDDISFNFKTLFENMPKILTSDFGILGFNANTNLHTEHNNDDDEFELEEITLKTPEFGSMMFIRKSNYITIDEKLKIFFGDDILYTWNKEINNRKIYNLKNFKVTKDLNVKNNEYEHMREYELPYFEQIKNKLKNE